MLLLALTLTSACGGDGGRTTLTFFQFKPEAVAFFEDLARDFEAENPDIRVVVNNVPDPETALRTRLVKGDVPDVLTLNANGTFGELASAGIFEDFAGKPVLEDVNPAYVDVISQLGASSEGAVNGVPFACNASGVLYNEDLFARYKVDVPQTWDELIAAAEEFKAPGRDALLGHAHGLLDRPVAAGALDRADGPRGLLSRALRRGRDVPGRVAGSSRETGDPLPVHPAEPRRRGV